jgi:hypothetical protein
MRERIQLEWGYAETPDNTSRATVGDQSVPQQIEVRFSPPDGQPVLAMTIEVVDGIPQCRALSIESTEAGREVRPLDLSAIRLTEWVTDITALFAYRIQDNGTMVRTMTTSDRPDPGAVQSLMGARKGKGARKLTPTFLEGVADLYRRHFHDSPIARIATAYGVSERTASSWITRARTDGLLPETTRGKKAI